MDLFLLESSSLKTLYLLNKNKSVRSCNIHQINKTRHTHGEFHHLYSQLREHPAKFHSYFRMGISTFDYILDGIKHKLLKKWTNFNKNPIDATERLAVTELVDMESRVMVVLFALLHYFICLKVGV